MATDPELSQTNCRYSGPEKRCPHCGKLASAAPPSAAPPEIRSGEWMDEMVAAITKHRKEEADYLKNGNDLMAQWSSGVIAGMQYALSKWRRLSSIQQICEEVK